MVAIVVLVLISIVSFSPPLALAQGMLPPVSVSGGPGSILDHGSGLKTFRDHAGRQGTITGLGNGVSIYRDSHGTFGPFVDTETARGSTEDQLKRSILQDLGRDGMEKNTLQNPRQHVTTGNP
jgi:hypothetical protein